MVKQTCKDEGDEMKYDWQIDRAILLTVGEFDKKALISTQDIRAVCRVDLSGVSGKHISDVMSRRCDIINERGKYERKYRRRW